MRLVEIYRSIQGEGRLTGCESIFIRASGCNLRCQFCDTPFASWKPEGEDFSVDDIVAEVLLLGSDYVVITGGEPMLFSELIPVCEKLSQRGKHITIETAGTLFLPVKCDLMSISPKLSNSTPTSGELERWRVRHEKTRLAPKVLQQLIDDFDYQLKFVVDNPSDCEEVEDVLGMLEKVDRNRVMLMPQGTETKQLQETTKWLEPYCNEQGLVFCPRKQIEWFGFRRGT